MKRRTNHSSTGEPDGWLAIYSYLATPIRRGSQSPLELPEQESQRWESKMSHSHLAILTKSRWRRSKKGWLATPTWIVVPIGVLPLVACLVVRRRLPMEHLDFLTQQFFGLFSEWRRGGRQMQMGKIFAGLHSNIHRQILEAPPSTKLM